MVGTDYTRWFRCDSVIVELFDSSPDILTSMRHVSLCDDFLPSFLRSSCLLAWFQIPLLLKGLFIYCFLYASYRLFNFSVRPGMYTALHPFGMYLLVDTCTFSTKRMSLSSSVEYLFQLAFLRMKRLLN